MVKILAFSINLFSAVLNGLLYFYSPNRSLINLFFMIVGGVAAIWVLTKKNKSNSNID